MAGADTDRGMWELDDQRRLADLVQIFKETDDKAGLRLCEIVEDYGNQYAAGKLDDCGIEITFFLGLALLHEQGFTHDVAHLFMPMIRDILKRMTEELEAEVTEDSRGAGEDGDETAFDDDPRYHFH